MRVKSLQDPFSYAAGVGFREALPMRGGVGLIGASSAGGAVDLMEASFFRSFEAVNGALFARRLRRSKTIDSLKTSEVHAFMRSTAWCSAERGRAAPVEKV